MSGAWKKNDLFPNIAVKVLCGEYNPMKIIVSLAIITAAVVVAVFAGYSSLVFLLPAVSVYLLVRAIHSALSADKLYAGEKMCPGCNSRSIDILPKSSMKLGYWEENSTYKHPAKCEDCGFKFYITTPEDVRKAGADAKTGLGLSAAFFGITVIIAILVLI